MALPTKTREARSWGVRGVRPLKFPGGSQKTMGREGVGAVRGGKVGHGKKQRRGARRKKRLGFKKT